MAGGHKSDDLGIYHEKQHLQMCLLHALNNLFQGENAFTKKELDSIADNLATLGQPSQDWNPLSLLFRPHRNVISGNYDANVLFAALKNRGKELIWYDRRKGFAGLDFRHCLFGIVVNFPRTWLGGLWKGRHWIALRELQGTWYNLDSNLPAPLPFSRDLQELQSYLKKLLEEGAEIFLVRKGSDASEPELCEKEPLTGAMTSTCFSKSTDLPNATNNSSQIE